GISRAQIYWLQISRKFAKVLSRQRRLGMRTNINNKQEDYNYEKATKSKNERGTSTLATA
ncbi:12289_t:CDS:1, partial [Ambispora leptoticha]